MRKSRSPYAKLLQSRARFVCEAYALGRLYHLGRYPAAVFDDACATLVHGELFRLNGRTLLDALDAYEGCGSPTMQSDLFYRDIIQVQPVRGAAQMAWSYPYAGNIRARPLLPSGRFPLR
jgi:gamma-glutamylcyclotransferase (GGCT)/AIG2-like uncharacterized protein YtfP